MDVRWLLCDYGQVLSTAPPPDEWDQLRRAAGGRPDTEFHELYWENRPAYDRADLTAGEYWDRIRPARQAPFDPERVQRLVAIDTQLWLHPHRPSVAAAGRAGARGYRLALFSNAPLEVANAIDRLDWLGPFERRFYSCRLRAVKPEPEAYRAVLAGLGAEAPAVVFFDDRPANVAAARALGIDGRLFEDAAQFDRL